MTPLCCPNPFLAAVDMERIKLFLLPVAAGFLLWGCAGANQLLEGGKRQDVPPEFRQKVGIYVHEKAENANYYGSASSDVSDLMSFHLEQVLPYSAQTALQEIFEVAEMAESGPSIQFKTPDLAGYFEIKTLNIRYDYPETDRTVYRADVSLSVEFKTMQHQPIWSQVFYGEGSGFSDANTGLTDFGKGVSSALEDAFQRAIDDMEDEVVKSPVLREYLRLTGGGPSGQSHAVSGDQGQRLTS